MGVLTKTHYLVMERATGDLNYYVKNIISVENEQNKCLQEQKELHKFMTMLISGVKHLHSNSLLHRDLKPANVLTFEDDDENIVLKIGDFGIAKDSDSTKMTSMAGTVNYMAPEVIRTSGQRYSNTVDVWSLGLVIYFLVTGEKR